MTKVHYYRPTTDNYRQPGVCRSTVSSTNVPGTHQIQKSSLKSRLKPIPEFTDTTDADTLDLHQYRYRVPIPIPVVTLQPPGRVVSRYYA